MTIQRILTTISLQRSGLDLEARTVPVTLATDTPLRHGAKNIILRHGENALDLSQVTDDGIPLLVMHNGHSLPIGRLKTITMGDHQTTAVAHFGRSAQAGEMLREVGDGTITDISVGADPASADSITELDANTLVVERWRPVEGSLVSIGLDPATKIHRSEEPKMPDTQAALESISGRSAEIRRVFEGLDTPDYLRMQIEALSSDETVEIVRAKLLDHMKVASVSVQQAPMIQQGVDEGEKYREGARAAIMQRTGLLQGDEKKANDELCRRSEFTGMSLSELARDYVRRQRGSGIVGMSRDQVVGEAFVTRGIISHGTSDFGSILNDVSNKALAVAYEETPTTWQEWVPTGSLPDFKQAQISNTSSFSDVDVIYNDAEYQYGDMDDKHELAQIETRGKLFSIGRRAIVNDDLNALTRVPQIMARSQARALNSACYAVLTANAAVNEDSVNLFHSNHGNLGTGATAPTVASLDAAFTSMATQNALGPDGGAQTGAVLNIRPQYWIGPAALAFTAQSIVAASKDPSVDSGEAPNPFQNSLTVVWDAVLDATSTTHWYLAADPRTIDTLKVFFLDGQSSPTLEQQEGFTRDGVIFKTRFDWDVAALDFRGLFKEGA